MLYNLFYQFRDLWIGFNVLKYITFRALMSSITGFVLCWWMLGWGIKQLRSYMLFQPTRREQDCPDLSQWHQSKKNTPTMGGIFMLIALLLTWLLWVDWSNPFLWLCIYVTLHLGIVGLLDDLSKLKNQSSKGIRKRTKFINQLIVGLIVGIWLMMQGWFPKGMYFPFIKHWVVNLGIGYIFWSALVIAGSSNAVNLTDGMDGLAIGCTVMVALTYAILSYAAGNVKIANYLFLPYVPGAGELAIICAGLFGVGLGYLWYNCYPAEVFMGDVGSLSIGGILGAVALFIKQEWLLVVAGGIFVAEVISVILQVGSFKLWGKRIFRVAPLHHHFQLKGRHEVKVIVRLWIVSGMLAILALASLKLR